MKGFLNLNKPSGITSAQAVAIVKRKLNLKNEKVGHTGTLDPMASGVLPIAIGRATRLFDFMLSKQKTYIAEFTFGYETNTLDSEGEVCFQNGKIPDETSVINALQDFCGEIEQVPPVFSAKSVNGVRAYNLARNNKPVNLTPCKVVVYEFTFLSRTDNTFKFKITCGSGTYIRSLCRDLAHKLRTFATMTSLVRTKTGVFEIENAVDLNNISIEKVLPCEYVLANLPSFNVTEDEQKILLDGKPLQKSELSVGEYRVYCGELIGIAIVDKKHNIKIKIWLK